ncbi:LYR motif containing protein 1 isoform X1 [Scomber scombrus]|uniref:LYR motif containing protein 1 isoform X1 n=1 Tax=Scomber scombrus TaxID=13677 RepID=A0AAV1P045_SCOSC
MRLFVNLISLIVYSQFERRRHYHATRAFVLSSQAKGGAHLSQTVPAIFSDLSPDDGLYSQDGVVAEARSLFRQNQQLADQGSIKKCIEECEARIEIGLHYRNPYPRATYLPPLGLATQKGRKLRAQQRLRKQAKPIYLQSHDET